MRKGFTLIELLVVIAIIAILAAILFPVFARAKAKAKQTVCLSNMKQLMLGILMYAQDYDEKLPRLWFWDPYPTHPMGSHFQVNDGSTGGRIWNWMDMTYPYINSWELFHCPSTPKLGSNPEWYRWNYLYSSARNGESLGGITAPARCFILSHRTAAWYFYMEVSDMCWWQSKLALPPDAYQVQAWQYLHNKGTNVAYADGHVKWISQSSGDICDPNCY